MSWWRRQRLPLLALVVAATATIGVHLWFDAAPLAGRDEPTYLMADGTVEIGGHDLTVTSARWDEFPAPAGSVTLSIRLDARSGADAENCGAFLLSEADGDRVWQDARRDVSPGSVREMSVRSTRTSTTSAATSSSSFFFASSCCFTSTRAACQADQCPETSAHNDSAET